MMSWKRRALAAAIAALVIPLSAARCGAGQHAGPTLPVKTYQQWINDPEFLGRPMVFGRGAKPPPGRWDQIGWTRRRPGQPRKRVWVQPGPFSSSGP